MRVLGSVTRGTLKTPHAVARGIRATHTQAATSKTNAPRRREDGVCLAARHPLLLTSRPRRGRLALHVCFRAADRGRVLGSVTCGTLQTPGGVAHGIRTTESKQQIPKRTPQDVARTAFASLLGTPCCTRHKAHKALSAREGDAGAAEHEPPLARRLIHQWKRASFGGFICADSVTPDA